MELQEKVSRSAAQSVPDEEGCLADSGDTGLNARMGRFCCGIGIPTVAEDDDFKEVLLARGHEVSSGLPKRFCTTAARATKCGEVSY